jgi:hypothetical protein
MRVGGVGSIASQAICSFRASWVVIRHLVVRNIHIITSYSKYNIRMILVHYQATTVVGTPDSGG